MDKDRIEIMIHTSGELDEIKKELVRVAVYHYQVGELDKDIKNVDFNNKQHLQKILRKYRAFKKITDSTKKLLLNQLIVSDIHIPNVIIDPYFIPKDQRRILSKKEIIEEEIVREEIIEEEIIEEEIELVQIKNKKENRPTYFCEDCNRNHFYDSQVGKDHNKEKEAEIEKTVQLKEILQTYETFIIEGYKRLEDAKNYLMSIKMKLNKKGKKNDKPS